MPTATASAPASSPRPAALRAAGDTGIARLVRCDDSPAAVGLFDRHGGMLFGLAMCMLGAQADAEAVVVRVFEDLCRQRTAFDSTDEVRGWLVAAVKTYAIDIVRARSGNVS